VINLRSRVEEVTGDVILMELDKSNGGTPSAEALSDRTDLYWNGVTYTDVPIWDRTRLRDGDRINGPAIITEVLATSELVPFF
jgi:N-methylhydantoinase A/oxoprolinase/acetone carboxylase beta subunit